MLTGCDDASLSGLQRELETADRGINSKQTTKHYEQNQNQDQFSPLF